jgi:hypothetical protein
MADKSTPNPNAPPVLPDDWQGLTVDDGTAPRSTDAPDYENMGWGRVGLNAAENLIPSAGRAIYGAGEAILHPITTAEGIGSLGYGALSKTGLVGEQDQASKDKNEAAFNTLAAPYTSVAGFKKALSEDPFTVLSAAALPLTAGSSGLGAIAEGLDDASIAGRIASAGSSALGAAATASDPLGMAGKAVGYAAPKAGNLVTGALGKTTGTSGQTIKNAFTAGAAAPNSAIKDAFNGAIKGDLSASDIALNLQKAASEWKNDAVTKWKADKSGLMQKPNTVDLDHIQQALDDERSRLGGRAAAIPGGDSDIAHQNLDRLQQTLNAHKAAGANSLEDIDKFKQDVYNTGDRMPPASRGAYMGVHSAIRDALSTADPQYSALMTAYQNILKQSKNLNSVGAGPSSGVAQTQVLKAIKGMKDPSGGDLINGLSKYDPTLPYQLSGMALRGDEASGFAGRIEGTGQALGALELAKTLFSGDFGGALRTAGAMAGDYVGQNPHLIGSTAYGAGTLSRKLQPAAKAASVAAKPLTNPVARRGIEAATTPLAAVQNQQQGQQSEDDAWNALPSTQKADGGSVSEAAHHRKLVDRLMKLADEAGKHTNAQTKPILNAPDGAVIKALAVAQKAI